MLAVLSALVANGLITIMKFIGAVTTGADVPNPQHIG